VLREGRCDGVSFGVGPLSSIFRDTSPTGAAIRASIDAEGIDPHLVLELAGTTGDGDLAIVEGALMASDEGVGSPARMVWLRRTTGSLGGFAWDRPGYVPIRRVDPKRIHTVNDCKTRVV
jgi:hypothetical protein